jgi:hypothetical protein
MSALSNLAEIEAYLANRSDVVDGDYGQPAPNVEMNLQRELEEAVGMIREMMKAHVDILEHYVRLAGCGDCGHWNPEEEPQVIASRAAIKRMGAP